MYCLSFNLGPWIAYVFLILYSGALEWTCRFISILFIFSNLKFLSYQAFFGNLRCLFSTFQLIYSKIYYIIITSALSFSFCTYSFVSALISINLFYYFFIVLFVFVFKGGVFSICI